MAKFFKLVLSIALCEGVGVLGAIFTTKEVDTWYRTLKQPCFNPPDWVFGPVWTTLYALMGVSLYRIWQKRSAQKEANKVIVIFLIHLVVNFAWSFVFFGLHSIVGGLAIIVLLWHMIGWIIVKSIEIDKISAWLLVPYLLWVSFASLLNLTYLYLN